jgi:hypothetical protein
MATRIEYLGFVSTGASRDYSLRVVEAAGESRTFVVAIPNEAFTSRHARFQDGPDICYQRLLEALAASGAAVADRIALSNDDLDRYRIAQMPKSRHRTPAFPPISMPRPAGS